ncbi:BamA/TamA family outer membrane protein [Shewanella olleyana]|uniref:BamA/TamA family outer membrane protein n=1 Tax=Shewanella olleyana TaxID=135626 RepID=UPI00200BE618|nr:BamA/TamA family outer membrane protein [Shewanella olleyana]MCL1066384.1 BamA/TamA family outer membrane protein [Shewanella olleyana]
MTLFLRFSIGFLFVGLLVSTESLASEKGVVEKTGNDKVAANTATAEQVSYEKEIVEQTLQLSQDEEDLGWMENFLQKLGADGEFDPDKLIDFSFLPGPFYNPEMDLGVGISAVGLYQVDPTDEVSQLSSLVINGLASINGALGVSLENKTFLNEDNQRVYLTAEIFDIPDVFYGVGYDENHQDDNRVDFDGQLVRVNPMYLHRLSSHIFVGAGFDFNYAETRNIDVLDSDVDIDPLLETSRSVGVNLLVNYDSRDNVLNPEQGIIAQIDTGIFRKDLGSKTDFEIVNALYSSYHQIAESDVLAWQVRGRFTHGDVPWDQLSKAGGGDLLRGYTSGRYRDKQMLLAQVEYRQNLSGRHGLVYWVGAGVISDKFSELTSASVLPNTGIGYRFEVKPRVNLRLDLAFGDNDTGFYFNVNEAF